MTEVSWQAIGVIISVIVPLNVLLFFVIRLVISKDITEYNDKLLAKLDDTYADKKVTDVQFEHLHALYSSLAERVETLKMARQAKVRGGRNRNVSV